MLTNFPIDLNIPVIVNDILHPEKDSDYHLLFLIPEKY